MVLRVLLCKLLCTGYFPIMANYSWILRDDDSENEIYYVHGDYDGESGVFFSCEDPFLVTREEWEALKEAVDEMFDSNEDQGPGIVVNLA